MRWPDEAWRRLGSLFQRGKLHRDLEEEMDECVRMKAKDLRERGMSSDKARSTARREFGDPLLLREKSGDRWGLRWLETPFQDLRHGLRQLRRNPGFTAAAVITLALGIGANTAIFSVVDAVLLRPLPFRNSSQLVDIFFANRRHPDSGKSFTRENVTEIESQGKRFFSGISQLDVAPLSWTFNSRSTVITCGTVSQGFFESLGIVPAVGRFFLPGDFQAGRSSVAVLSHQLWVSAYDASSKVLGQTITLNGAPRLIVGVAPGGLHFLEGRFQGPVGAWLPAGAPGAMETYDLLARLMPNVTVSEARAGLDTIAARLALQDRAEYRGWTFTATPAHELLTGDVRPALLLLLGATALVLLIAIVNVANLLLVRGWQRAKEVAMQAALGATRRRVIFQWAIESSLLGLLGALAGLLLALLGMRLFHELESPNLLRMPAAQMNWAVIGLCVGVALLAGVLIGAVPAIQISRLDPNAVLRSGDASGRTGGSRELRKTMSALMVAEIALAVAVTASSLLLIRSFASLTRVDTGMRVHHFLTLRVYIPPETYAEYSKSKQWKRFVESLLARVRSVPGVESAGAANFPLLIGEWGFHTSLKVNGVAMPRVDLTTITPGYFRTLGIPLLAGRRFSDEGAVQGAPPPGIVPSVRPSAASAKETLASSAPLPVIVNRMFARTAYGNGNPLGRVFRLDPFMVRVVGVVGDTKDAALATGVRPAAYASLYRIPHYYLALAVHTSIAPSSLVRTVEGEIWSVNSGLAVTRVRTMKQLVAENEAGSRSRTLLLGIFASLGLALAVLGVYGVFSYSVARRTREFGIRMALGAQGGDVLRTVLLEGARLATFGVVAGLAGTFILARLMRSLLFGVTGTDPVTLAATVFLITLVSLLACSVPARRASRADPASALRYE